MHWIPLLTTLPPHFPKQTLSHPCPRETWTLKCEGDLKSIISNGSRSKLSLETSFNETSLLHESILTLGSVSYLDSGPYVCSSRGGGSSRAYLWVDDVGHLIDFDEEIHYVNIYRSQRVVLPCRPTHPGVKFR
ncbi:Vascular endothelial growth factor receptor 1like [Caligus rogercresseyi]|uniref:Vascular endothelial growth factor receptor 1like n=1 Tax=Caligus rogercresseyi TaxID=217165 RepID=A0A7T8HMB0_CALRO|nr:Vascular endothelial growth factor receptor 1like [Caligus rogercresseyi]